MNRFGRLVTLAPFVIAAASCNGTDDAIESPATIPAGAMAYNGYDDSGQHLVTGWIRLDLAGPAGDGGPMPAADGEWQLRALVDPQSIGPQVGEGMLTLSFVGDHVVVDLNPGNADNNVTLSGQLTAFRPPKMRYEGRWSWLTIAGVRRSGPFVAVEP